MKTATGPFKVIWIIGDKEVTQEEVIEYIKQRRASEVGDYDARRLADLQQAHRRQASFVH